MEEKYRLLKNINSPEDLKRLPSAEMPALAGEIREFLIENVNKTGGHLASNLGVVELSIALHRVFDAPKDHLIFDVGHQSYVHKILTGRRDDFSELRQAGGLSGFTRREESEYDCFGAGHSSTSVSAALGFAEADKLNGSDAYTVVVLGDGAFTGGMIHEALNNCKKSLRLILIINENEMSISKNTGLFARNLSRLRSRPGYYKTKGAVEKLFEHIPLIGKPIIATLSFIKRKFKKLFYASNYFEQLGFSYFGPTKGNDVENVEDYLRAAKARGKACVVHLKTVKGKGYEPAEKTPDKYHGLSPKNATVCEKNTFSQTFGNKITEIADKNNKACAITAAMMQGTGLTPFKAKYPKRFFDVGIAEEHAVTFAAGLSANGYYPCVAIYSTFLQRAYDNIIHDVALQNLPVLFCIDRAGLNAQDGATHHGIFDVSFLLSIPNMEIWEPMSLASLENLMDNWYAREEKSPMAIRYPSGTENEMIVSHFESDKTWKIAEGVYADFKNDAIPSNVIITYGRLCAEAIEASKNADAGIIMLEKLSSLKELGAILTPILKDKNVIIAEEGIYSGSVSMNLKSYLDGNVTALAIYNDFVVQTKAEHIYKTAGIDSDTIRSKFI